MDNNDTIDLKVLWCELLKCRRLLLIFILIPVITTLSYCKFIAKPVYGFEVYMAIPVWESVSRVCTDIMKRDVGTHKGLIKVDYRGGINTVILTFRGKSGEEANANAERYLAKTMPELQALINSVNQTVDRKIVIRKPVNIPTEPLKPKPLTYTMRAGFGGLFVGCLYVICRMLYRKDY